MATNHFQNTFVDSVLSTVGNWSLGHLPDATEDVVMELAFGSFEMDVNLTCKTITFQDDGGAPTNVDKKFSVAGNADFSDSDIANAFDSGFAYPLILEFTATAAYTLPSQSPTYRLSATGGTITPSAAMTGAKKVVNAINFTGASALSMANGSITCDGNVTLGTGGLTNAGGRTLTVGGNLVANGSMIGAANWTLTVTGTVTLAAGITITKCQATNPIDATGCIDGGGNSANITFGVSAARKAAGIAGAI